MKISGKGMLSLGLALLSTSCGQGNGPLRPGFPPEGAAIVAAAFTVGGTVTGLSGVYAPNGMVLQNNLADDLTVTADGPFGFATALPDGSSYSVTVLTQPGPAAITSCTVANGTGVLSGAAATSVTVTCAPIACAGFFTGYRIIDDLTGQPTGECFDPGNCFSGVSCYCQGPANPPLTASFCGPTLDSTFCIF